MDKLSAMEVFVRVMECGSFSRAAESLNLANATVTSSVRNLEKHLGVTLIQRNTRHLRLTDEGEIYFPKCLEILSSVAQTESVVKVQSHKIGGILRVESPFGIGQTILCPMLPEFSRRHPDLSIAVNLTNDPRNLIERATDIAIRMDRVEHADLVARPIYEARYVVCGAPALVSQLREVHPAELNPKHCLGLFKEHYQSINPWTLNQNEHIVEITPKGPLHFNNTAALIQAAVAQMGLIYVLDIFVRDHFANGSLEPLYEDWNTSVRTFHAVTVKSRFASPKIRAFIDFLLEIFDPSQRPNIKTRIDIGSGRKKSSGQSIRLIR